MFLLTFLLAITVDTKAVDKIMNDTIRAWHAPGAAVAIVVDDKVVYAKGYGVEELGGEAVTPDTLFQIASTTKAFTTTAMAMLVDEKKLAWDDAVRKHVAYFRLADPCADSLITLRDIASHRTGLTRHDELWDNTPLTREDVIRAMANVKLTKPIRTTYQYQNIMFITAGEAVASASGMPWDDFVRTRIFEPLKMTSTRITDAEWSASNHATGHRWDRKTSRVSVQTPIETQVIGAGGAIKSSARDMANWIRFHLADGKFEGKQLVSPESLNETKMPQTVIRLEGSTKTANPESNLEAYGLGWVLQDYAGTLLVSHSGSLNGFRTHVDLLPKEKAGFVVLINIGRSAATTAMRNALTDLLLARPARDWNEYYLTREAKLDAESDAKKADAETKRHRDTKPSRPLAAYAGTYEHAAYGTATIALENDALVLRWQRMTLPLTHWHYDTFSAVDEILDVDEQVEFDLDAAGEVKTLKVFGQEFVRK
ncbi:MAG TPA: serine hydrolase [Thermoanaerobaculia bacterium]|jgi:CubicO group peptidase (beta-lactamase class C family)